jgi:hypothetical protein
MKPAATCPEKVWKDYLNAQEKLAQHQLTAPTAQIRRLHKKTRVVVKLYGVRP